MYRFAVAIVTAGAIELPPNPGAVLILVVRRAIVGRLGKPKPHFASAPPPTTPSVATAIIARISAPLSVVTNVSRSVNPSRRLFSGALICWPGDHAAGEPVDAHFRGLPFALETHGAPGRTAVGEKSDPG